jgi:hypothetical protein
VFLISTPGFPASSLARVRPMFGYVHITSNHPLDHTLTFSQDENMEKKPAYDGFLAGIKYGK